MAKEYQHIPSILLDPFRKVGHFNLRSKKVESIMWKIEGEYKKKILGYEIRIPAYIMELMDSTFLLLKLKCPTFRNGSNNILGMC